MDPAVCSGGAPALRLRPGALPEAPQRAAPLVHRPLCGRVWGGLWVLDPREAAPVAPSCSPPHTYRTMWPVDLPGIHCMHKLRQRDVFGCHVNLFVSTFGDRAKNGRKTGVGWAIGSNNLTSWSQLTPSLCWVGAIFVLLTALATRNGQRRLQKRPAQQNRASRMAFEDIARLLAVLRLSCRWLSS